MSKFKFTEEERERLDIQIDSLIRMYSSEPESNDEFILELESILSERWVSDEEIEKESFESVALNRYDPATANC
jgi:hypothetical protein